MAVKIGNSYVSEAALSFAQAQENSGGEVLKDLKSKFPNLKFQVGTAPFSGSGLNNVSISPKILKEMQNNPEKRVEYEALIYDISNTQISSPNLKSHGFIIGDDGGLRGWGISQHNDGEIKRVKVTLDKNDKKSWWQTLLDELNAKKSAAKNSANKINLLA
ncbi:MAG: hypothetical protein IJT73_10360 [Selenomonadaceae bacterium]|nr:hypothetical protein [Selenomonadaceae bacterium]